MQILPSVAELRKAAPGLALVVLPIMLLSELAYWIESRYVDTTFNIPAPVVPIMIAAVMTILATNLVDLPSRYNDGLVFSTRWLLKAGIVLYAFNFSYALWFKPGAGWILVIGVVTVLIPLVVSYFAGKAVHLDDRSSLLAGIGTGICGISAIMATQQATKMDEEAAGMALATILLFGTLVLFAYPVIDALLNLSETNYGIWTGATTLDLPQLVAAAIQGGGSTSLLAALWVKSIRIGLLVPVILLAVVKFARDKSGSSTQLAQRQRDYRVALRAFPLFIVAFFLVILFNTYLPVPNWLGSPLATGKGQFLNLNFANVFLTAAIIGICFRVRRDVVRRTGLRILMVGGLAWILQSLLVFWLVNSLPIPAA